MMALALVGQLLTECIHVLGHKLQLVGLFRRDSSMGALGLVGSVIESLIGGRDPLGRIDGVLERILNTGRFSDGD